MVESRVLPDLDASWDYDHPEETEKRFQDMLSGFSSADSDHSFRIEILTQIARAQGLQKKYAEAGQSLKEAAELLDQDERTYRVAAKLRYLLEAGRLHTLQKTPSQARPLFAEAWTLASNTGEDYYAIDAAQMLAATEPQKVQKEWTLKAIALAENSPQPRAKLCQGALYSTLGWAQFEMRQYDDALTTFQKALSCIKAEGKPRKVIVGKWAIARTLRAIGRIDEAVEIQKDLISELSHANMKDGLVYEELAECLQSQKKTAEAQVYFDLAYKELSTDEWLKDNKPERIKRLKELGKVK